MDRKFIVFLVAVAFLITAVIYRLMNPFEHEQAEHLTYTNQRVKPAISKGAAVEMDGSGTVVLVQQFLERKKRKGSVEKDLFAVYRLKPSKSSEKKSDRVKVAKKKTPQPIVNQNPVAAIKKELATYKWYGIYQGSKGHRAVFLAKNKTVLVARTGDRIDGKYQVEEIQDNYLKIRALEINQSIYLETGEFNHD